MVDLRVEEGDELRISYIFKNVSSSTSHPKTVNF